jgi:hypothetical protein
MPIWQSIVARFQEKGHPQPSKCRLELDSGAHDNCRHFAATRTDGKLMFVAPELAGMPFDTAEAILAHEAGHVVDLSSPGVWWYRGDTLFQQDELPSKGLRKHLARWNERSHDEIERVADAIAELVMERRIGYVGGASCLVQTWDEGIPRPVGLK